MIYPVFIKSLREQLRNFWILLLTLSMAPFFVMVYYLINEAEQLNYDVTILSLDQGSGYGESRIDYAEHFISYCKDHIELLGEMPITLHVAAHRKPALQQLSNNKTDVLLILPEDFTATMLNKFLEPPEMEIMGNLTRPEYLVGAVMVGEIMNDFMMEYTGKSRLYRVRETPLAETGTLNEFERWMPGMIILSTIMLMFSATIAIIAEVDQKTILRFKLSTIRAWQYLLGVGGVQVLVGLLSVLLTYLVAHMLGYENRGSFSLFLVIAVLSSVSMIAFSLLLAGLTKSVTEVLVVGNFPLFIFMFFSGAAFPITAQPWFHIAGYGISWQTFLAPTAAIQALNKVSILGLGLKDVFPEIIALMLLICLYFGLGLVIFQRRHLRTI